MMADKARNNYDLIRATEDSNDQRKIKKQRNDDEASGQDSDILLPEERCCCSALQRLASPYIFGVFVCLLHFFQVAAFSGTGGGVLSTIEKRFQLKTSELAPFLIINDVVSVVMVLFVAYYGHTSHRPRLIGGGGIIVGVGLMLCTLPQFIYETPPQFSLGVGHNENGTQEGLSQLGKSAIYPVCEVSENTSEGADTKTCTEEEERSAGSLMWQASWFIGGQILAGIGAAPIMPLAVTYMDDSLKRSSTSVYVACMFIATSFGPLLGFSISSFSLTRHADFYKGPVYAQAGDPNWLGAWWLCFAITGILLITVSIPILLFPKKIRRRHKEVKDTSRLKLKSKDADDKTDEDEETEEDIGGMYRLKIRQSGDGKCLYVKGFLSAIRRLVTNLTFVSLILGVCSMLVAFSGGFLFMAKYLETQFGLPASGAPMLLGIMTAPGSLFGNLIGGFVVKKLKLGKKGMARMVVILKPLSLLLLPGFLFLGCDNRNIAGITTSYPTWNVTTQLPDLMAGCNDNCACSSLYKPVCGSDGVTYATPCHAGCLVTLEDMPVLGGEKNMTIYTNCSCIGSSRQPNPFGLSGDYKHVAIPGECPRVCNTLIPFIVLTMVNMLFSSIVGNPGFMLQLRTVDEDDRSIAVGFTSMLLKLLGFIPSPIIFGAAIQTACLLLQSSCGKTGNCLVYDIVHFRHVFFGLYTGFSVLAAIFFAVCYFSIRETKPPEGFEAVPADGKKSSDSGTNKESTV